MKRAARFVDFVTALGVRFTPAQLVFYRVAFDALDPAGFDVADREIARQLFGEIDTVPALARTVVVQTKGARIGGTRFASLRLLHLALTHPLDAAADATSALAPGEVVSGLIVGPDLRLARQGLRYALGAAKDSPAIRKLIVGETSDSFTIRRADGRHVAIECLPATRGGSAVRGRSLVGAVMSEAAFFRNADFVVNDQEVYRALLPRIVPGGQLIVESTPWAESGLLHELFTGNHGKPIAALAAHCPTTLMRPDARTAGLVAGERTRDPDNARREFDAEFMGAGSGLFFDPAAVDACVLPGVTSAMDPAPGSSLFAAADFGFRSDSSAAAVAERRSDGSVVVLALDEKRPKPGAPLRPSEVVAAFAGAVRSYGIDAIMSDSHYIEAVREHLTAARVRLSSAPEGQAGKVETYVAMRQLVNERRLRIPDDPRLVSQMKALVAKPTSGGGLQITSPRRPGSGHGDVLSAVVLAVWQASRGPSGYVGALPGVIHARSPIAGW